MPLFVLNGPPTGQCGYLSVPLGLAGTLLPKSMSTTPATSRMTKIIRTAAKMPLGK